MADDKDIWTILRDIQNRLIRIETIEQTRVRPSEHCQDKMTELSAECRVKCDTAAKDINELGNKVRAKTGYKYVHGLAIAMGSGLIATWIYFIMRLDRIETLIKEIPK